MAGKRTGRARQKKAGKISLRLIRGSDIALGPGKADLLEGVRETGSIAAAGRRLGMSYRRAWSLAETMNACFRAPLVATSKGGAARGGANLTALGEEVLARYRRMETKAGRAAAGEMRKLLALVRA